MVVATACFELVRKIYSGDLLINYFTVIYIARLL
jgi:hypothetical protein